MRYLLLLIIKLYWFLIPPYKRRKCIFKVSCSNYVYCETINNGLFKGLKSLLYRINNCNHEFDIYIDFKSNKKIMKLKYGGIINENNISDRLL